MTPKDECQFKYLGDFYNELPCDVEIDPKFPSLGIKGMIYYSIMEHDNE